MYKSIVMSPADVSRSTDIFGSFSKISSVVVSRAEKATYEIQIRARSERKGRGLGADAGDPTLISIFFVACSCCLDEPFLPARYYRQSAHSSTEDRHA